MHTYIEVMQMSMHPVYEQRIVIPDGCKVTIEERTITIEGPKGSLKREFADPQATLMIQGKELVASTSVGRKHSRALVGTMIAHARNMFDGVLHGYVYEMKIVYSHFPISVEKKGADVTIKNLVGERGVRKTRVFEDVDLQIREDDLILSGIDIEHVSQSAASIQQACRLRGKDKRVFMDGVYVIRKHKGEKIKSVV